MGFGKFLVGGLCAVGAVVAAPVVLPTVGLAVAGSALTGAAGVTAGLAIASTSATTAAVAAGVAGTAIAGAHEKKMEKREDEAVARGVRIGSEGKEELQKAHDKENAEKDAQIQKQKEHIREQDEYIKEQDEFIDEEILKKKEDLQSDCIACPSCGKYILKGSLFCSFCGKQINDIE